MPTISELTSVYTADISDLQAKHARAIKMLEDFKRASGGASNPFAIEGADKATALAAQYAATLRSLTSEQTRASSAARSATTAYDLETASIAKLSAAQKDLAGNLAKVADARKASAKLGTDSSAGGATRSNGTFAKLDQEEIRLANTVASSRMSAAQRATDFEIAQFRRAQSAAEQTAQAKISASQRVFAEAQKAGSAMSSAAGEASKDSSDEKLDKWLERAEKGTSIAKEGLEIGKTLKELFSHTDEAVAGATDSAGALTTALGEEGVAGSVGIATEAVTGAEGLSAGLLGIGTAPIALGIAGIAYLIYEIKQASDEAKKSLDDFSNDEIKFRLTDLKAASATEQHAVTLKMLVDHYDKLRAILKPTSADLLDMQSTLNKIAETDHHFIGKYDAKGNALNLVPNYRQKVDQSVKDVRNQMRIDKMGVAAQNLGKTAQDIDTRNDDIKDLAALVADPTGSDMSAYHYYLKGGQRTVSPPVEDDSPGLGLGAERPPSNRPKRSFTADDSPDRYKQGQVVADLFRRLNIPQNPSVEDITAALASLRRRVTTKKDEASANMGAIASYGLSSHKTSLKTQEKHRPPHHDKVSHDSDEKLEHSTTRQHHNLDTGHWRKMMSWAATQGFAPTYNKHGQINGFDPTGKGHTKQSQHYTGDALDISERGHTKDQIEAFKKAARARGLTVFDETKQPKGEREWSGPHIHLGWPGRGNQNLLDAANASGEVGHGPAGGAYTKGDEASDKAAEAAVKATDELARVTRIVDDAKLENYLKEHEPDMSQKLAPGAMKDQAAADLYDKKYSDLNADQQKNADKLSTELETKANDELKKKADEAQKKADEEQLRAANESREAAEKVSKAWGETYKEAQDHIARLKAGTPEDERGDYIKERMKRLTPQGGIGGMIGWAMLADTFGKEFDLAKQQGASDSQRKNYADALIGLNTEFAKLGQQTDAAKIRTVEWGTDIGDLSAKEATALGYTQKMTEEQAKYIVSMQKYVDAMKKWKDEVEKLSQEATSATMQIIEKIEVSGSHGLGKTLIQTGNQFARQQANQFLSQQMDAGFKKLLSGLFPKPKDPKDKPLPTDPVGATNALTTTLRTTNTELVSLTNALQKTNDKGSGSSSSDGSSSAGAGSDAGSGQDLGSAMGDMASTAASMGASAIGGPLGMLASTAMSFIPWQQIFSNSATPLGFGLADGGYIPPGYFALTGEKGPEYVTGGRTGMTITPMKAPEPSTSQSTQITNHYHGVGNLNSKTASQIAAAQHRKAKMAAGHA